MELTQVLLKPRITEKMTELAEGANKVAFLVNPKANKLEVKKAVEAAFNVTVLNVNIVSVAPVTACVRVRPSAPSPVTRKRM